MNCELRVANPDNWSDRFTIQNWNTEYKTTVIKTWNDKRHQYIVSFFKELYHSLTNDYTKDSYWILLTDNDIDRLKKYVLNPITYAKYDKKKRDLCKKENIEFVKDLDANYKNCVFSYSQII